MIILLVMIMSVTRQFGTQVFFRRVQIRQLTYLVPIVGAPSGQQGRGGTHFYANPHLNGEGRRHRITIGAFFFRLFNHTGSFPNQDRFSRGT